jgi:hypothetical protein
MPILFGELLTESSKLFAKSEFAPASSSWPALSFSSDKIARDLQAVYRRGRDFVIYVGTSSSIDTPDPQHRQRLMSVVEAEPRVIVQTKQIVEPSAWSRAQMQYPGRWDVSLPLARAWDAVEFPRAHEAMPATYSQFQNPGTRGHPIPVLQSDFEKLRGLKLETVELVKTARATAVLDLNVSDAELRKELSRLTNGILRDIERALKERGGINPLRTGGNYSDVYALLLRAWNDQNGVCRLCGMPLPLTATNKLLRMSRDRIDSADKAYDIDKVQLTHLGCNLAKSDATLAEWEEYLATLRAERDA